MPENPSVDLTDLSEQDAMAAEWAADQAAPLTVSTSAYQP